jgi:hypothetical protein
LFFSHLREPSPTPSVSKTNRKVQKEEKHQQQQQQQQQRTTLAKDNNNKGQGAA